MNFGTFSGWELLIILVIVIIIFGVGKLPQVGGAIGKSIREFREASTNPKEPESSETPNEGKV
jgi:sec-independent protein translocase protein TatA